MRIGVECGGTFTDLMMFDDDGALQGTAKVFSTPDDPSRAVTAALEQIRAQVSFAECATTLLHGSTVATNAVLEHRGPRLGLLVTKGFRDILSLARHDRDSVFDLRYQKPPALVTRDDTRELAERIGPNGEVITAIDPEQVRRTLTELSESGIEGLAVVFLHSYANSVHEQLVRDIVAEVLPDLPVSISSEVAPEFREYERANTTTVDAFVRPTIQSYVRRLAEVAYDRGLTEVAMMHSGGGVSPLDLIVARPLQVLFSGPAAGVAGAVASANGAGIDNIVTFDMGGTSTDVCLVVDGKPSRSNELRLDRRPIRLPMIDIATVGAGGGSIVGIDSGGMLTVGPVSAGADPGPAAYGRGGTLPTVTDANVVRGLIRNGHFEVGGLTINLQEAVTSLQNVAENAGRSVEQLVEDTFRIANVTMAGAIRRVSIERGVDPKTFTLVAYGGAGPLHAASVADEMRIRRVLVPTSAGLHSAYGLLAADFRHELSFTDIRDSRTLTIADLTENFAALRTRAEDELRNLQQVPDGLDSSFVVDMRYRGQGFELSIPVDYSPAPDDESLDWLVEKFHNFHEARYGHATRDKPVEIVTHRLIMTAPRGLRKAPCTSARGPVQREADEILFNGVPTSCDFLWRDSLPVGFETAGPAVIEEATTTTFVPTGWQLCVDGNNNLILTKEIKNVG